MKLREMKRSDMRVGMRLRVGSFEGTVTGVFEGDLDNQTHEPTFGVSVRWDDGSESYSLPAEASDAEIV